MLKFEPKNLLILKYFLVNNRQYEYVRVVSRNAMELICKVQNYEWGKRGSASIVAQLIKTANVYDLAVDENLPYAELWMGTHVNAPSILKETGEPLSSFISRNPECLGRKVLQQFQELPFLLKVLSVGKALSIQAHPSKKHAEQLHSSFPDIYKDPNHKPEMAIALTPFEALCGFRPLTEIRKFIEKIPELLEVVGEEVLQEKQQFVQKAFRAVLTASKDKIEKAVDGILGKYLDSGACSAYKSLHVDLIQRLHTEYPYDNGILMVYFLNYLRVNPSEAVFLGANEPHAYLFGDCVECMACSDNVVRAGLTPKFVDVETLCSMLNYEGKPSESKLFAATPDDAFSVIFRPPVPDFAVVEIRVSASEINYGSKARESASILLIVSGRAYFGEGTVQAGTVLFLPANESVAFTDIITDLLMYQAIANV